MAQLAIKGHPTRGKEIIEILEMLGGINKYNLRGDTDEWFILNGTQIQRSSWLFEERGFTLEEFLENFPYKVGDKVKVWVNGYRGVFNIQDITWDSITKKIKYRIHDYWYSVENLQPYKEETMKEKTIPPYMDYDIKEDKGTFKPSEGTLVAIDLTRELRIADEVEVILGDYEFVLKDGKTYFVKKKPQYPKTYEECCEVLGYSGNYNMILTTDVDNKLFNALYRLKVCRDAYWKIAGEQMGLGKPWKPDWYSVKQHKFGIYTSENQIKYITLCVLTNLILVFPTAEMRDEFYKNFKDLIEQCKELL